MTDIDKVKLKTAFNGNVNIPYAFIKESLRIIGENDELLNEKRNDLLQKRFNLSKSTDLYMGNIVYDEKLLINKEIAEFCKTPKLEEMKQSILEDRGFEYAWDVLLGCEQ